MHIYIDVEAYAGGHVRDIIEDMVKLADKLEINVWCDLNGVRTLAKPRNDPAEIYRAWEKELKSSHTYKTASQQ